MSDDDAAQPTFSLDQLPHGGKYGLKRAELRRWLLASGLARENGSADSYELTEAGAQAAAGVRELQAWTPS